jgi:hypothetical protein
MSDHEDRLRRALHEVADSTAAAAQEPPALGGATVVALTNRRRRTERWVLGGVAAAVVLVAALVAGVLAGDGGDGDDETVAVADDPTTSTTDDARSTTTSSTSSTATTDTTATTATSVPGSTATTVLQRSGELLATGDGFDVRRDGACVFVVWDGDVVVGEECERDVDAWLLAAPLPDGRTVHVAGGRRVVTADAYGRSGIFAGDLPMVGDFTTGLFVVTDALPDIVLLREGANGNWVAGIYGGQLRTEHPAFSREWFGYQRATGSLSFDRSMEFGGYYGSGGSCAVARQVATEPAILGTACLTGGADVAATLIPTQDPGLYDIVGIAMALGEWRCVLPDGGSCGSNQIAGIAGFAGIIAQQGPIRVGDAAEVTIETDRGSVTIPVPN